MTCTLSHTIKEKEEFAMEISIGNLLDFKEFQPVSSCRKELD